LRRYRVKADIEGVFTKAQFDYVAFLAKLLLDRNKLN
jgi:hypothetical protein